MIFPSFSSLSFWGLWPKNLPRQATPEPVFFATSVESALSIRCLCYKHPSCSLDQRFSIHAYGHADWFYTPSSPHVRCHLSHREAIRGIDLWIYAFIPASLPVSSNCEMGVRVTKRSPIRRISYAFGGHIVSKRFVVLLFSFSEILLTLYNTPR